MISLAMRKLKTIIKLTRFFPLQNHTIPIQILKQGKTKNLQRPSDNLHANHNGGVFSLRETIIFSRDYFENVPSLKDFHYRARKLKHVIQILIKFIHDIDSNIVDGTGIGYREKARLNWKRGR